MSDILIKNMEMPKERKMFVIEPDGSVWVQIKDTSYFCTGSKAVALPEHGDLIDRMELAMNVAKAQEEIKGKDIDPFMLLGDVLRWIALAPTIVEANYGSDN